MMEKDITMENVSTPKNVHCKLTYNDQIRRFVFSGTEFAELRGHISQLISLPPEGFVLKYVDNESDLITVSTNEELTLALELSDQKVLRLVAENVSQPPAQHPSDTSTSWRSHHNRGPHHYHHGGPGRFGAPGERMEKWEAQKMHMTMELDMLKNTLAQLPADHHRRYKLMMQIHRLEGRLLRWDTCEERKGHKGGKQWKKHEKKYEKHEKKYENFSPETIHQIQLLKAQIASLKPTLFELKTAKKNKKAELQVALQTGSSDKESIWQEILLLKERIAAVKKEIKPMKDNIRALKGKK